MIKKSIEKYLKIIYELSEQGENVTTNAIADSLDYAAASVTGMLKKLSESGYVIYEPYKGVQLSAKGKKIALEVIRHHRLIELFLAQKLNIPWDKVHKEAELLENVLSEYIEDKIDESLGFPIADPHGAPIPDKNGNIAQYALQRLADLKRGQTALIAQVSDRNAELLRYLADLNMFPETELEVIDIAPYQGPLTVRIRNNEHIIGRKAATEIFVKISE